MRIVIDFQAAQTDSRMRGIGRQARSLTFGLIEKAASRHELVIVLNAALTNGLDDLRHDLCHLVPPGNVRLFDIPGDVRELEPGNLWRMRAAEIARETFIAGLRPDLLYVTSLFEGMIDDAVVSIGTFETPYPTVTTLFDLIPLQQPQRYLTTNALRRFYYRRVQSLKRADRLIAISEHVRQQAVGMLHLDPADVDVAPLAADSRFRPTHPSVRRKETLRARYGVPDHFILYVGAIEPRKNVGILVESFARLPPQIRDLYVLVICGRHEEPYRLQLLDVAVRAGVPIDRLIFPGHVGDDDLPDLYSLCGLFVFPSEQEGFGLPPLEAMACGAPVLAARNSSLIEVVERNDLLFGTHDVDDLAGRMTRVLSDSGYARTLGDWGIERAARFSWSGHVDAVLASLERSVPIGAGIAGAALRPRLRLAFVSPLPPARSGVADYALELLPELSRRYEVECITEGEPCTSPWVTANYPVRDPEYLRTHSARYDRIIYAVGNSPFHDYMLDLLGQLPGVVILHDFFLSGLHLWMSNVGERHRDAFAGELYLTHGVPALAYLTKQGRSGSMLRYAANRAIFDHALGVIVHSRWAVKQAEQIYGERIGEVLTHLPLLKAASPPNSRAAARDRLGIEGEAYIVCSFGMVAETKLSDVIVAAWRKCAAAYEAGAELVFVGERPGASPFRILLDDMLLQMGSGVSVRFSGHVSDEEYQDYLAAADLAVQLRASSRGETSKAVLDCMAASLPLVLNAHGPSAEVAAGAALMLPDRCTDVEVAAAIDMMHRDASLGPPLAAAGKALVDTVHRPDRVARQLIDAVEAYSTTGRRALRRLTLAAVAQVGGPQLPAQQDVVLLAEAVTRNTPRVGLRRLLVDVTLLAEGDEHTGIERVVRAVLAALIAAAPPGYRVEPVWIDGGELRFARGFLSVVLGLASTGLPDSLVDHDEGDVYLAMEWAADRLPGLADWLTAFRSAGGRVVIAIHDVLPLLSPEFFPARIEPVARDWFATVLRVASDLICFSRTVADDVVDLGKRLDGPRRVPLPISYVHLAADVENSLPTHGLPEAAKKLIEELATSPIFLMVGTVEPRKGHRQVIEAFELMWERGVDAVLVIIGRRGWSVDGVDDLVARSAEEEKRLFWFDHASDEWLTMLYSVADALIAGSYAEGFGLPLIEACRHGLPVIARDIPIFREIAPVDSTFFTAQTPDALATALQRWLAGRSNGRPHRQAARPSKSWSDVAREIGAAITSPSAAYRVIGDEAPGSI